MKCIYCGGETRVIDKRLTKGNVVRRRRVCLSCGKRFTTYERPVDAVYVIKRDGRKELFSREKIITGLEKAYGKSVPIEKVNEIADRIEKRARRRGIVKTSTIGKWVLSMLKKMDKVAYLRFALVYKDPKEGEIGKILEEVERNETA